MPELKSWSRAPRNFEETARILAAQAKKVGQVFGVVISVGARGDNLFFIDETGADIIDPGGVGNQANSILCATSSEVDSGDFLKLFAGRSLYACLTARFNLADHGHESSS